MNSIKCGITASTVVSRHALQNLIKAWLGDHKSLFVCVIPEYTKTDRERGRDSELCQMLFQYIRYNTSVYIRNRFLPYCKKNKHFPGSESQNIFQVQTSFHHDQEHGFIRSVENVIFTNIYINHRKHDLMCDEWNLVPNGVSPNYWSKTTYRWVLLKP